MVWQAISFGTRMIPAEDGPTLEKNQGRSSSVRRSCDWAWPQRLQCVRHWNTESACLSPTQPVTQTCVLLPAYTTQTVLYMHAQHNMWQIKTCTGLIYLHLAVNVDGTNLQVAECALHLCMKTKTRMWQHTHTKTKANLQATSIHCHSALFFLLHMDSHTTMTVSGNFSTHSHTKNDHFAVSTVFLFRNWSSVIGRNQWGKKCLFQTSSHNVLLV